MIPNLDYIDEIAENDTVFKNKLISIIKNEFPIEKDEFLKNITENNFLLASQNVHKLKHKINMLGLKKGSEIAIKFENELLKKNNNLKEEFIEVIKLIENYLNKI
jgi:HPt (histidine-containing phosphotransfer) domain-containing protein